MLNSLCFLAFGDELEKLAMNGKVTGAIAGSLASTAFGARREFKRREAEEGTKSPEELRKTRKNRLKSTAGTVAAGTALGTLGGHYGPKAHDFVKSQIKGGLGEARNTATHFANQVNRVTDGALPRALLPNLHLGDIARGAKGGIKSVINRITRKGL